LPDGILNKGKCDTYDPESFEVAGEDKADFGTDVFPAGRVCEGDQAFYLVGARIDQDEACINPFTSSPESCPIKGVLFEKLYNVDKLPDFGLSIRDAVFNARNSWRKNGKKNGWDATSFDHADEMQGSKSCRALSSRRR